MKQIKEISKLVVLITSVLYFLGFITVSAFWARFGFFSFEIVNARFIIAGVYAALFLVISLFLVLPFREKLKYGVLKNQNIIGRNVDYLGTMLIIYTVSNGVKALLDLAEYKEPGSLDIIRYDPNKFLIVGRFLTSIYSRSQSNFDFWLLATVSICIYLSFVYTVAYIGIGVYKLFGNKTKTSKKVAKVKKSKTSKKVFLIREPYLYVARLIEVVILTSLSMLSLYSLIKINKSVYDFRNLGSSDTTLSLVFSWFYTSFLFLSLVIYLIDYGKAGFPKAAVLKLKKESDEIRMYLQSVVTPIFLCLVYFGQIIYPRIPFAIGGGQPRQVEVVTKEALFSENSEKYLVGESSKYAFIVERKNDSTKAFQVNLEQIKFINTRTFVNKTPVTLGASMSAEVKDK